MAPTEQGTKAFLRRRALARLSHKCPVIKRANQVLDKGEALDAEHAISLLELDLRKMPEGEATAHLLQRIIKLFPQADLDGAP